MKIADRGVATAGPTGLLHLRPCGATGTGVDTEPVLAGVARLSSRSAGGDGESAAAILEGRAGDWGAVLAGRAQLKPNVSKDEARS